MLLAGQSRLTFNLSRADDGSITVGSATLRSEGVDLAASGTLTPDMVPRSADVSLKLGQAGRAALPFVPGDISVAGLTLNVGLDAGDAAPWRATIKADAVKGAFGEIGALAIDASGQAQNLARPSARGTSFRFDASATGFVPNDLALRDALGPALKASGAGSWATARPVSFDDLNLVAERCDGELCRHRLGQGAEGRVRGKRDRPCALLGARQADAWRPCRAQGARHGRDRWRVRPDARRNDDRPFSRDFGARSAPFRSDEAFRRRGAKRPGSSLRSPRRVERQDVSGAERDARQSPRSTWR